MSAAFNAVLVGMTQFKKSICLIFLHFAVSRFSML